MTAFLLKTFIPGYDKREDSAVRSSIGALSGGVGIAVNILLFLVKLLAGILSGSVSITADALNNLSDASGSVLTLIGFRLAGKPADVHHPYGHARFEYLSGLAIAAMIMFIGFELGQRSVIKILRPEKVTVSVLTGVLLVVSIAVKLWLCLFNRRLGDLIRSKTLLATAVDSRNDCITTAAVLVAALVERFLDFRVDGVMGLGVALFILWNGWGIAKETISALLGEGAAPELRKQIIDYVEANPKVLGYHDLMVHDYGPGRQYASLHVEMDYKMDPLVCHEIIDQLEWKCRRDHGIHLVIHYDPVVTDDPILNSLKNRVDELLYTRHWRLRQHDFRVVPGRDHLNLVFDVSLPAELRGQEEQLRREIETSMNQQGPDTYHVKITYDLLDE